MIDIYVNDETETVNAAVLELVTNILKHAAEEEGLSGEVEVSLTFMFDDDLQKINAEYRDIDEPTDVISFALEEIGVGEVEVVAEKGMPIALGDILISVETARRQAEEYQHELNREFGFLALHGFLHLLGYDHLTESDEKKMFGRQKEILDSFGLRR